MTKVEDHDHVPQVPGHSNERSLPIVRDTLIVLSGNVAAAPH
jgi:hypothetical protein